MRGIRLKGDQAEVIVLVQSGTAPSGGVELKDWRHFAGTINSSHPAAADNNRIDADLTLIENAGSVASKLAALDRLQESLTLDDAKAQAWVQEGRATATEMAKWQPQE